MMEKRAYKDSEDFISLLGFGTMRLPILEGTSEIDEAQTARMIDNAFQSGVNYFDTAWPYHGGKSETVIGEILSHYPREKFYLADKLPLWEVKTPDDVPRIFEAELKKCQVDYFDFYLLHNMNAPKLPQIETMKAYEYLAKQKEAGRIRHLGFSFHDTPTVLKTLAYRYDWDFAQIQLNYLDWELLDAKGQYEILTERGLPVVVMEPVRGGALASLSPEAIQILKEANPNQSPASWALRFAASHPNILTVLSGMSNEAQVADNLRTFQNFKPISPEEEKTLAQALAVYRKASPIPCTGCRYCMDCPNGVDIPHNFMIYNRFLTSQNSTEFLSSYSMLAESKRAANCVSCGLCREKCPQRLDIPNLMPQVDQKFQEIEKPRWFY